VFPEYHNYQLATLAADQWKDKSWGNEVFWSLKYRHLDHSEPARKGPEHRQNMSST
jgi:hypothetical protein